MTTLTLQSAASQLPDLIHSLSAGEEILLTEDDRIVARLMREGEATWQRPGPGLGKGMLTIHSDDDEHLLHFSEYMP